jgi:hypothetical protein
VKVRIKATPRLREIDGIKLDDMEPGTTREVSPTVGSWLVAEGYAEPEMRHTPTGYDMPVATAGVGDRRRPT